jgi:hypothetical protein
MTTTEALAEVVWPWLWMLVCTPAPSTQHPAPCHFGVHPRMLALWPCTCVPSPTGAALSPVSPPRAPTLRAECTVPLVGLLKLMLPFFQNAALCRLGNLVLFLFHSGFEFGFRGCGASSSEHTSMKSFIRACNWNKLHAH